MPPRPRPSDWHFPRHRLAADTLASFDPGPSNALTIFERRRMGKTEFLIDDLTPCAERSGWCVFYHSFLVDSPKERFVEMLHEFIDTDARSAFEKITGTTATKATLDWKILKLELAKAVVEKDSARSLFALFGVLAKTGVRCLFLLDEIQALAEGSRAQLRENERFIATLRTCLDVNKTWAKAVFNGSSQNGLRRLFAHKGAAFFNYAHRMEFPLLGPDFTLHLSRTLAAKGRNGVDPDALFALFSGPMHFSPFFAVEVSARLLKYPSLSLADAWRQIDDEQAADHAAIWAALTAVQHCVLRHLASGADEPFGKGALSYYSRTIGAHVTTSAVQTALKELCSNKGVAGELIRQTEEGYDFQDETFRQFVRVQ